MFCIGLAAYFIKYQGSVSPLIEYDYSVQDSIFFSGGDDTAVKSDTCQIEKKGVDSKLQLADFSAKKNNSGKNNDKAGSKKININTAGIKLLTTLPGIGEKTAEKIIEHRNRIGKFKSAKELMNVKGIGEKKFAKLKDFITVE